LSDECVTFLESLSRPLSQEKSATAIHLFAKNLEADMYNFVKLGELLGKMYGYTIAQFQWVLNSFGNNGL
jgi:hypothetical protein